MTKNVSKYVILGGLAACVINVASADSNQYPPIPGDEVVVFAQEPEVTNIACGALPRGYVYEVLNDSSREEIEIDTIDIIINADDEFQGNTELVTTFEPCAPNDCLNCEEQLDLEPGESCFLGVLIDPEAIECPMNQGFIDHAAIDRTLFLGLDAGAQKTLVSPIDIEATILGTSEEYALLGDLIELDEDVPPPFNIAEDAPGINGGQTQVSQDVGYGDAIFDEDDIILHHGAQVYGGFEGNNFGAFADAAAAYEALQDIALTGASLQCQTGVVDLSNTTEVTPGVYCLAGNTDNDYFIVNGRITFRGNQDSLFVFVMPSQIDNPDLEDDVQLRVESHASYRLRTDNGEVNPGRIFWIGADVMAFDFGASMAGNFITKGLIFADPAPDFSTSSDPVGPAIITGRLLGLNESCGMEHCASILDLNGNAILAP